ncbi:hypothetical protein HC891_10925 [Candidatus Gracilibacteria bacterium]|nr:hypothetical protein [Candidatus Gracilibacteria bacterium]
MAKLTPNDGVAGDRFGESLAITGSTVVIGAPGADGIGAAYVFDLASGAQQAKLRAGDGQSGDAFGFSVAVADTTVVVGAPGDDDNGLRSGSIYVFELSGLPGSPTPTPEPPTPMPSGPATLYASLQRKRRGLRRRGYSGLG